MFGLLELLQRRRLRVRLAFTGPVDQVLPLPSTLAIAVMVFQLRVVAGTPKSRSNVPR
jgi:hypothetical protein